jgi:hypothetical protein
MTALIMIIGCAVLYHRVDYISASCAILYFFMLLLACYLIKNGDIK